MSPCSFALVTGLKKHLCYLRDLNMMLCQNVKEASESDTFSDFEPLTSGASSLITSEGGK